MLYPHETVMQPSPPRCEHSENWYTCDICTLCSTMPFVAMAFICHPKIHPAHYNLLYTKLVGQEFCVLLNASLESDLNAWILEHQCRCPLVMQYISYDENICTHVYYYFRKHPSRSVNLTSLHRVWRKSFAFRESSIHYIPIEI